MPKSKWASPDRQAYLVELWTKFGNQCLLGHRTCPIPEHYTYTETVGRQVPIPVKIACHDRNDNPIRDKDGNQLYLTVYKVKTVSVPQARVARLYELKSESIIKHWVGDDRAQRQADWQAERKAIHSLGERRLPIRGQFSAIGKDVFYGEQPQFYLLELGISGLTFKPFARVRLASSFMHLHVDLGDSLKGVSKNRKRKAIRYGKVDKDIYERCSLAVRDYLKR